MIVWLAGTTVSKVNKWDQNPFKTKLHSYYHKDGLEKEWFMENLINPKISLFLDSGAYSAWTQGAKINLSEYIQFIKDHESYIDFCVNLDVIPGSPNQKSSQEELDYSASQGWKNWEEMIAKGIPADRLIHVFHQGEDFEWLKRMVNNDLMCYIGLSPGNDKSTIEKTRWLDACMPYVTDKKGYPIIKFHGFGVTSNKLMWRYPWYSVDSTSWVITGRLGSILVPKYRNGKWDYRLDPWKVGVSDRSPSKKEAGKHFSTYSQMEREVIQHYLDDKGYIIGQSEFRIEDEDYGPKKNERWHGKARDGEREVELIEEPGLSNDYKLRDELNIIYYLDLEKAFPKWPWPMEIKVRRKGLF